MSKVIVTLTTLPTRIVAEYPEGIKSNIDSLINQDFEGEYEIHFNVPSVLKHTGETYVVPEWMRELATTNPKFKIFDNLEDLGPVTKLAHTIKRVDDPEAIIIVCDDDLVYHPGMVAEQVKNQSKYERTAVGYDGVRAEDSSVFADVRNYYVVSVPKDIEVNHLQHYKTVSYRRGWFEDDFFTDFIGRSWNDDILVAAYMGKQGIKKLVACYEHEEQLLTIEQWQEKGGVTTFPVLRHTSHEGAEGCNLYRQAQMDENYMEFVHKGYLK
jgi:glycosyltransferase involved in cell wall biosynthesis